MGTRVLRREDPALLRGQGHYVDDLRVPELEGAVCATFVRSPFAHAAISSIDVDETLAAPGVVAVIVGADLDLGPLPPRMPWVPEGMWRTILATDRVRFVGEPVAVVLTETPAQGEDAAERVIVDYDPLDAVVDPLAALEDGAPVLFDEAGTNLACEFLAEHPDPDLFAGCDVVVSGTMVNQRLAACSLEGRAMAAVWLDDRLTVWSSNQAPHLAAGFLAGTLGLERDDVRVITPDVGGGFGAKIFPYVEELVVAWAARHVGRPVRWVETRTENMLAMGHGRDHVHTFTIGGGRDGRVLAYRLDIVANAGAYPTNAAFLPTFTRMMAPGTYDIERLESSARVAVTNTMSIEAYRGAGRPEATAAIERAMDWFAAEIGMDPAEVRRRNLVGNDAFPFTTKGGAVYDAGDYVGALDAVLEAAGYDELRAEQARRRSAGAVPWLGIGVSTYVEITGGGGTPNEYAGVSIDPDGSVVARTGSSPHGQGLATAFATLVADRLGVDPERVRVVHGDTALVPRGGGTMGSRSLQAGGSALVVASEELVDRARELAAEDLEADPGDVIMEGGRFHVVGTPAVALDWADLAARHADDLVVELDHRTEGATFPFGAHVAVVEVDPETGKVTLQRLIACDDAGTILNPMLAEGQRMGGIAQGAAQAMLEEFRYDDEGNPLTATFADYPVISAAELPSFELVTRETATPNNVLGAKGIGESGTIGATPAVQSAVVDALAHLGVRHVDMPTSPERVWRAIRAASPELA
jgi:carbon-monoxide dehydrogenase large subunit